MSTHQKPEQVTLSNGIPVVLQHYDGPVAATYWWIKTGSADEKPAEAGFAHFLEHMLFKDAAAKETGKASTGQMARAIESMGGDINAYTSFDQTVYHVTCAAHHWERVLDVFGAMAKPQRFLKSDFEREREVILEELRKNNDSPGRQLFQNLFTATFDKHPYGKPVIGFPKTLKAATVSTLEAFYRRQYVSGNMGLILVGPLDGDRRKKVLQLLEKHYGKRTIPKKAAPERSRPIEKPYRDSIEAIKKAFDVKTPTLAISFRAPSLKDEDIPALDLLSGVLAMGELSRLYQHLFYRKSLAIDVSGGLYVPHDPGMIYFQAEIPEVAKLNDAAREMFQEIRRFIDEGPTEEELKRVLVNIESERLYATQTADGMAGRLGFLRFILGDLEYDRDYLDQLRTVDKAAVQSMAAKYFDQGRMAMSLLLPKADEAFDMSEIVRHAQAVFPASAAGLEAPAQARVAKKPGKKSGQGELVRFHERPSGLRIIHEYRPVSHVMSVHAAALGGLRLELGAPIESIDRDWGASYMMSLTWTKGTTQKKSREIAALVEGSAASLDGYAGRNTSGLQMTGLARDWRKLSDLFAEVLVEATFPEDEVEHSRRVAEDSVRSIEDHSAQLCSKLFLQSLYENHPYGRLTTGSLESLAAMNSEKLRAFHRAWIRPERLVVSVVGNVREPELLSWVEKLEERLSRLSRADQARKIPEKLAAESPLKAPRWVERSLGREQIHILVGGLGTRIDAEDRHAVRLMQTLLGGQSGRLFIELREKKSLAYTVAPISTEGVEPGYMGTYIACAPQKRDEAIQGMREVLERLAQKGPTASEMKRAKEFYLGRRAMDLQSDSSLAASYGLEAVYRIPHVSDEQVVRRIEAVSAKAVQEVCRKYLVEPYQVTSVVG